MRETAATQEADADERGSGGTICDLRAPRHPESLSSLPLTPSLPFRSPRASSSWRPSTPATPLPLRLVDVRLMPLTMSATLHPAGLSTDSLDLDPASSGSPPATQEEQWSDAHDTFESDTERDPIEEVEDNADDLTVVQAPKLPPGSDKTQTHEIETPSPTNVDTSNAQERASDADTTSIHSMPVVQVTEPTSPTLPATPRSVHSHQSSTTAVSNSSLAPPTHSAIGNHDRRRRNRATLDVSSPSSFRRGWCPDPGQDPNFQSLLWIFGQPHSSPRSSPKPYT